MTGDHDAYRDLGGGSTLTRTELRALELDRRIRVAIKAARAVLRRSDGD